MPNLDFVHGVILAGLKGLTAAYRLRQMGFVYRVSADVVVAIVPVDH